MTLTLTPHEGWQGTGVTVTDRNGAPVTVTKNDDGTYSFTMPAGAVSVSPVFEAINRPAPDRETSDGPDPAPAAFADVDREAWYRGAVDWAIGKGVMNGVSDTRFAPGGTTTRAMAVTMLWRLAGGPDGKPSPFEDVPAGSWYEKAVNWATETGVVNGISETRFGPDEPVTREQLAAILYRYAQARGQGFAGMWYFPLDFRDASEVSDWADEAVHWMTMKGILTGTDDGRLAPKDSADRAQIAAMFMRLTEAAEMTP